MSQQLEKQLENSSISKKTSPKTVPIKPENYSFYEDQILNLKQILEGKEKVIENLENKLSCIYEHETLRREKELRKLKLRYEVMARMEVNQKLSEINAFLEKRAEEQSKSDLERDKISEQVQSDLSERLQQSRSELQSIKLQMKGNFALQLFYLRSLSNK